MKGFVQRYREATRRGDDPVIENDSELEDDPRDDDPAAQHGMGRDEVDVDRPEDVIGNDGERGVKARCARCHATADVVAPQGYKFAPRDEDDTDDEDDGLNGTTLCFTCPACETSNLIKKLRTIRLVRIKANREAADCFRDEYRRRLSVRKRESAL
jgi:hypothetical protein